jgi:hypothetical protein
MSINRLRYLLLLLSSSIILSSCSKETCYNCATYDMLTFDGNLQNIKDSVFCCVNDDTWEEISWGELITPSEDLDHNGIPDSYQEVHELEGANLSTIDLSIYTTGIRIVENTDLDGDGILNQNDTDIDNDGIPNYKDTSPYGTFDNYMIEYIVCTEIP